MVWTDTRTGTQELFFDRVATLRDETPEKLKGIPAEILIGVTKDGGGLIVVGGKIIKIPPRGPKIDILHAMAALDSVEQMKHPSSSKVARSIKDSIGEIVKNLTEKSDW